MQLRVLAMIALIWLVPGIASAQHGGKDLTFRVLETTGGPIGINAICCDPGAASRQAEPVRSIRTRYGGSPFWLKLEGIPGGGLVQFRPILDEVTLYARSAGSDDWQVARTGDLVANAQRVVASPFMALPLPEDVDTSAVFALIDQPTAISIEAIYWPQPAFIAMQGADRTLKMFLLGFVCAIIIYNLVVSVLVRDPVFALNAACIGSLLVLALYLSGYGASYVWADRVALSNTISILSIAGGVIFGAAFIATFLRNPGERLLRPWPLFIAPALVISAGVVLLLAHAQYWTFQLAMLASSALLLIVAATITIHRAILGERKARILLVPLFMAIGPGIFLVALDKIGGYRPINLGNNAMELTLAMEAILFSLAIASRIRLTEAARREATMKLLRSQQRNATVALAAQDEERQRLAKELHDSVGQEILVIVSRLKRLARDPAVAGVSGALGEITRLATATMDNLRRISHAMHPASIEHLGLDGAVQELIDQFNTASEIAFVGQMTTDGIDISRKQQLHVVRIVQECLANVAKHSGATRCEIDLARRDDRLEIRIADNGVGVGSGDGNRQGDFGPGAFGLGLTSVGERVRSLEGSWQTHAGQGGGLVVSVTVPLRRDTNRGAAS